MGKASRLVGSVSRRLTLDFYHFVAFELCTMYVYWDYYKNNFLKNYYLRWISLRKIPDCSSLRMTWREEDMEKVTTDISFKKPPFERHEKNRIIVAWQNVTCGFFLKKVRTKAFWGEPAWLSWLSSRLLVLAQVRISGSGDQAPRPALCSVGSLLENSPSPSSPTCALSL